MNGETEYPDVMGVCTFLTTLCPRGANEGEKIATVFYMLPMGISIKNDPSDLIFSKKEVARPGSTHVQSLGLEIIPSLSTTLVGGREMVGGRRCRPSNHLNNVALG